MARERGLKIMADLAPHCYFFPEPVESSKGVEKSLGMNRNVVRKRPGSFLGEGVGWRREKKRGKREGATGILPILLVSRTREMTTV